MYGGPYVVAHRADLFDDYQRQRIPATARVQRNARLWGDMWHAGGLLKLVRDTYLRERDPNDRRHLAYLYEESANSALGAPAQATATATTAR